MVARQSTGYRTSLIGNTTGGHELELRVTLYKKDIVDAAARIDQRREARFTGCTGVNWVKARRICEICDDWAVRVSVKVSA